MRLLFCGTPEFAVPTLRRLLVDKDFSIEAVLTQPDRPKGRGLESPVSPVKAVALAAGIPVRQPETVRTPEVAEWLAKLAPDAVVILAYGQIIPADLLAIPRLGWINLHASMLPKYRGAAPIAWAIANGEWLTGLTTMKIDAGMDTGPTLIQTGIEILPGETAPELSARMAEAGAPLVVETLRALERGNLALRPQNNSLATYAPILKREHGRIDWALTAEQIYNRIRGFAPWPGAFTSFRARRCHIWGVPQSLDAAVPLGETARPGALLPHGTDLDVVCGGSTLMSVEAVQVEGRKRITTSQFLSGARLAQGERFGP
jgi:methionyl-tRNA formyltransferase